VQLRKGNNASDSNALPGPEPIAVRAATWVFAGFFFVNSVGNLTSASWVERYVMTVVVLFLGVSFLVVALSAAD
jgi:hypothetical protein